jgi:hypothetical protein
MMKDFYKYILTIPALYLLLRPNKDNTQSQKIGKTFDIEKEVINRTGLFNVYEKKPSEGKNGKFSEELKNAKNKAGVYLISLGRKIIYIGHSSTNLYKTITRHFHEWKHEGRQVSYDPTKGNYKIQILYTSGKAAPQLECYLISNFKPVDNDSKCKNWNLKYAENILTEEEEEAPF